MIYSFCSRTFLLPSLVLSFAPLSLDKTPDKAARLVRCSSETVFLQPPFVIVGDVIGSHLRQRRMGFCRIEAGALAKERDSIVHRVRMALWKPYTRSV